MSVEAWVCPRFRAWATLMLLGSIILGGARSQTNNDDDLACLQGFKADLKYSTNSLLTNWTATGFPCNSNFTTGVTCSSGRVIGIVMSNSGLSGSISSNLSTCGHLTTLDLSSNQLSGNIPSELVQLQNLVTLNFSLNDLGGGIPVGFGNCKYLHTLDLHNNKLTGQIPADLGSLATLQSFDVSNNDLSGIIPSSLSNTSSGGPRFNASSFQGNRGLSGYPLSVTASKPHALSVAAIVGIGLGSGMLSLFLSFTAVCIWLRVTEQRLAAEEGKISQLVPEY